MSINLSDRLSAIVTDFAGITHIVWEEQGYLWHARYDANAEEWLDAQAIAAIGQEPVIGLNLVTDPSLVNVDSSSTTTAPGLAVVWQQGKDNDSDFYYTGAQYNANGDLQWLETPQALTSDQVGDLDPRSLIYQESGTSTVLVMGTKVDLERAANLGVTEDTDLYTQQFSLESRQFPDTTSSATSPAANYEPPLVNDGLVNLGVLNNASTQSPPTSSELGASVTSTNTSSEGYQGLGGTWGGGIAFDVYNFFTDAGLTKTVKPGILKDLVKRFLNNIDYAGAITGGKSFDGQNLILDQNGTLTFSWELDPGKLFGGNEKGPVFKGNQFDEEKNNVFGISGLFDTQYTFDNVSPYDLSEQDQTFGISLTLAIPLLSPYEDGIPGVRANAVLSLGVSIALSATPTGDDYYPETFTAALELLGTEALQNAAFLGIGITAGALDEGDASASLIAGEVAQSAITMLADTIVGLTQGFNNEITIGFPVIEAKLTGRLGFSWLNVSANAGVTFAVNYPIDNDGDNSYISAEIPLGADVRLGPLVFGVSIDPTWYWDVINSSGPSTTPSSLDSSLSSSASLQSIAGEPQAEVTGSLLTVDLGANYTEIPPSADFTVTITRGDGTTQTIPVFNVIAGGTDTSVILQLEQSIAPSQNLDYRNNNTPTPTPNQITVSFQNNQNIENSEGSIIANFSDLNVTNQTPQTFIYTYNPTSGNSQNYTSKSPVATQSLVANIEADLGQDGAPALSLTDTGQVLGAWVHEVPPIIPIAGFVESVNGTTSITLNFIENLGNTEGNDPSINQFTVTDTDSNDYPVTNVQVLGNSVTLTLGNSATSDSQLLVSYQLDANNLFNNLFLTDATDTTLWTDDFENFQLNNVIGVTSAPQIIGAGSIVQTATTNQITLVFDQDLSGSPSNTDFTVNSNGSEYGIEPNVTVNNNTIILTVVPPTGLNLIGNGDFATVTYTGNTLSGQNGQVAQFNDYQITTAPTQPTTVLKTWIGTPGGTGATESIPGSDGFNFTPASAIDQKGNNVVLWVHADAGDISTQLTPGEIYTVNDAQIINESLDQSEIYYSIYDATTKTWSLAAPLATQSGSDGKIAVGTGPDGNLMAAWLNYTDDIPTIYWSSLSYNNDIPSWSAPEVVIESASPDALTELSINELNGQPAIFWSETQPSSYAELTYQETPTLYYRLDETGGTLLDNSGLWGGGGNGTYSGTVTFGEIGALENPTNNTGDPNPAVYFAPGAYATLPNNIQVYGNSFTMEFWFKVDELPSDSLTLLTLDGLASVSFDGTELILSIGGQTIKSSANSNSPIFNKEEWYYVVATYDGEAEAAALFVNGAAMGAVENITLFQPGVATTSNIVLADSANSSGVYLDEVAYYKNVLSYSDVKTSDLISPDLTGLELLEIITITNEIGNKYNAQYVNPLPPGPDTYYVVYDEGSSSWQSTSAQISPLYRPVATALNDANTPTWDIVSSESANSGNTYVKPNDKPDTLYRYTLAGSQGKTISGVQLEIDGTNYGVGSASGTALTGNQLGIVIGNQLINTLNPESTVNDLNYTVMGQSLDLNLLIDNGSGSVSTASADLTIYFADGSSINPATALAPFAGTETPWNPDNATVVGIATVTEANDSSLSLIDSGFPINTTNPAMGYRLASGDFDGDGKLDVAVGNRGYTDSSGNVLGQSTVQILFNGGNVLSNGETNPLTPNDLTGNPNGVLITGILDTSQANGDFPLSLATGDIDGDGNDDLVIGAPNVNSQSGAVYVIYGSYLTAGATVDLSNLGDAGYQIANPANSSDLFGFSVAIGNFDGNDYADIAIGAPNANGGNGAVYSVLNSPSTPNNQTAEAIYNSDNPEEYAGYALTISAATSGGSNAYSGNTSTDDLIIGAPGFQGKVTNTWTGLDSLPPGTNDLNSFPAESSAALGAVYVFQSNQGTFQGTPDYTFTGPALPSSQNQTAADLLAGSALASDDWDGDGIKDLAIGAPKDNNNAGAIYLLKGGSPESGSLNTVSSLTLLGGLTNSQTGQVLARAGDVNDDNYEDLLVTTTKGANGTGQGYVVFGEGDLLGSAGSQETLTLSATSADDKQIMLLNGSQPNQLTGTATVGIGDINGDTVDDLMITAPNQFQLYAVYGHPWLADDGSLKLPDISADNGFVTDGLLYDGTNNTKSNNSSALINEDGTLYLAYKAQSNNHINFTTSNDGGITWNEVVELPQGINTENAPSLAFFNGTLYLSYLGFGNNELNITHSTDNGQTWSDQYTFSQTSSAGVFLTEYQGSLMAFFVAENTSDISYIYSDNPQSTGSWSQTYTVQNPGVSDYPFQTSSSSVSATVLNGSLYVAYRGGLVGSPNNYYVTKTTGESLSDLSWSVSEASNLVSPSTAPGIVNDGSKLYLTYADTSDNLIYSTSSDSVTWSSPANLSGESSSIAPSPVISNGQLYVNYVGQDSILSITSPEKASAINISVLTTLSGTGNEVSLLGDVNGDGFADVLSGGSPYGSIITFGKTTQALIDAAAGTDQIIVSNNGQLSSSSALGDINGDGLNDIGFIDTNNTFYVVLGDDNLAAAGSISLSSAYPTLPNVTAISAVGDLNGDGYDDILLNGSNATVSLVYGNAETNLSPVTLQNSNNNDVWGGIGDVNGDGYADIGGGDFNNNIPTGKTTGNGSADIYFGTQSQNVTASLTLQPPPSSISNQSGITGWQTILGNNPGTLSNQTVANTVSYAEYNGYLYMVYNGSSNDDLYLQRSTDGVNWKGLTNLGSRYETNYQPSLAVFDNTLYLAFTAPNNEVILAAAVDDSSNELGVSFPTSGGTFFNISGNTSKNAPTLVASNDHLFVFFLANNNSNDILYAYAEEASNSSSWSSDIQVTGQSADTNKQNTAVSATINENGDILLAFFANQGSAGNKFNTIIGQNPDTSPGSINWTNFQTVSDQETSAPPSVISVGSTAYLFFNGPGDENSNNTINYLTSTDGGKTWENFQQIPGQITQETSTPYFFNENLYVGFNASGTPNYINTSITNPIYEPNNTQQLGRQFQPIGDFNGDGVEDLAILASGYISNLGVNYNNTYENNEGALFIYYGGSALTDNSDPDLVLAAPAWGLWNGPENSTYNRFTAGSNQTGNAGKASNGSIDLSNFSGIGDINGDGFDDVVVASPNTDLDGNTLEDGLAFVVFGGDTWGTQYSATTPFDLWTLSNNQTANSGDPAATNDQGFVILGLTTGSQAGISLSGGGDVNGDGFDDFMLGAPGNNDSLTYTIFGSDFTSQISQTGTIGNDVMVGSPTGESFVANIGDDQIYSNGGIDVVYAGPGDDYITISDPNFRRIDGGTGTDTVAFEGYNGQDWNLTTLSPGIRLRNIEILITQGYGDNTLTLDALTVNRLADNNTLTLVIDPTDSVNLSSDFSYQGTVYQNNQKYAEYKANNSAARVLINQLSATVVTFNSSLSLPPLSVTGDTVSFPDFPLTSLSLPPLSVTGDTVSFPDFPLTSSTFSDTASTQSTQDLSAEFPSTSQSTQLSISNPKVSEADGVASFVLTRTGDLEKYVKVIYRTQDRDGKAGDRYLPVAGVLTFAPGETTQTVAVPIPDDGIHTGDRQFELAVRLLEEGTTPTPISSQNIIGNANGEQIRRWNYTQGDFSNSLMGAMLDFSTTVTNGQVRVSLPTQGIGDFNDFFNYSPQGNRYESVMRQDGLGATLIHREESSADFPTEVQLVIHDGGRGDADGIVNGLVKTQGYVGRIIPGLITNNNQTFWAPTKADGQVQWRLINRPQQDYELGWIPVDDLQGGIDGLTPTDPGYEAAALARKQVIFQNQGGASATALTSTLAQNSFLFPDSLAQSENQFFGEFSLSNLDANRFYMLYSQVGEETAFSITESPTIQSNSRGYHQLTFQGITAEISSNTLVVPGQLNQPIAVEASLSRAAAYHNLIALYQVDSLTGGLDTNGDRQIDLRPGDLGYAKEALTRAKDSLTGVTLTTPENLDSTQEAITLLGSNMYGMVIIPNATLDQVLTENPLNDVNLGPVALFSFGQANPDGISHMARLGANLFGFEDMVGGGDRDYNDMILQIRLQP